MGEVIHLLVGDQYPFFCHGLQASLTGYNQIAIIGSATCATELWALCQENQPDLLLLDFSMTTDTITIATFKQSTPRLKLLVMLADKDGVSLAQLKQQGTDGVILKSEPSERWLEAILAIAQNEWWSSMRLVQTFLNTPLSPPGNGFNQRELQILQLVASGKKDSEIAQQLNLCDRMIRYHLEQLRTRLGVQSRAELAVAASRLQSPDS